MAKGWRKGNRYEILNNISHVYDSKGKYFIIDTADLDLILLHTWHIDPAIRTEYVRSCIFNKLVKLHRFLLNANEDWFVDHINNNGLDNRRINLRLCSMAQNVWNSRANMDSKYKGVVKVKNNKRVIAKIGYKRDKIDLGWYNTPEEAALEYDLAAKILFGEFAYLNFPEHEHLKHDIEGMRGYIDAWKKRHNLE